MYHRVLTDEEHINTFSNTGIIVNVKTFEKQINYLNKYFTPLSLNEVIKHIDGNTPFNSGHCLITFDDGWHDNYTNALPILRSNNTPALIFLPTNYISPDHSDNLFWQEYLSNMIHHLCTNNSPQHPILTNYNLNHLITLKGNILKYEIGQFINTTKQLSNIEIDEVISNFHQYFLDNEIMITSSATDKYISWNMANEMVNNNIQLGSHAVSHRLLTKLDNQELENEVALSKSIIEQNTQSQINSIAYPNGSYDSRVTHKCDKQGYKLGFTTNNGYFEIGMNVFEINRINIHQSATSNTPLFLCRVLGIF